MNGYKTYYWESEREAEIDFIIQYEGKITPIEVKSADNTKSKSLKVYQDRFKPELAINFQVKILVLRIILKQSHYTQYFVYKIIKVNP